MGALSGAGGMQPLEVFFPDVVAASVPVLADIYNTYEYNIDTDMIHTIHKHTYPYTHINTHIHPCKSALAVVHDTIIHAHTDVYIQNTFKYIQIHAHMD